MSTGRVLRATGPRCRFCGADARQGRSGEAGSATVLALGVIGVLLTVLVAMAMLGAATTARQQAQVAADLGAVAGAQSLRQGAGAAAACDRAAHYVQANVADLDECTVDSGGAEDFAPSVLVRASVRVGLGPGWSARATARAGLVEP